MDYKEAVKNGKQHLKSYLQSKGINTSSAFSCICRDHEDKHPSMSLDRSGEYCKCFSCGKSYDIYSAMQELDGISFNDALDKVCREYGINYERSGDRNTSEPKADYTNFYLDAHKHLNETDYRRGISNETLDRFNVGYVKDWINPKAPQAPASPRLIIPISKGSYLARDTRSNAELTEQQQRYTKTKVGSQKEIFNGSCLKDAKDCIFITEGEIDALSIIDQGFNAIATGSTAYIKNFYDTLQRINNKEIVYFLFLDNDESGRKASDKLCEMMKRDGFFYEDPMQIVIETTTSEDGSKSSSFDELSYKDANDWLLNDKESFISWLKRHASSEYLDNLKKTCETERDAAIEDGISYKRKAAAYIAGDLLESVQKEASEPITSGYRLLDHLMDGGFYEGLYVLGADTGTGKTTLIMQIAESIAQSGKDVLIIALEMSSRELITRSVSRLTFEASLTSGKKENARTYRDILRARQLEKLTDAQYDALAEAIIQYQTYADHIFIIEGIGDINADRVADYVKEHEKQTGNTPVVILDYLQILAPINTRYTDKQNVDASIVSLKRLSRDHHTPVICISSLNRETNKQNKEGKTEEIAKTGFKESGAIEYAADMILALGRADAEQPTQEEEENGKPRIMSLKILKARSSRYNVSASFEYYPKYSYFKEI